jgi:aerobic carbon-monoxide dehydrogenase medium subunit
MMEKVPKYNPLFLEKPTEVIEAVLALKKWGPKARPVAGNTTLFELANEGALVDVERLVDIMGLGLSYVREDEKEKVLCVGATTTFTEIGSTDIMKSKSYYALKEVSSKITPPQVRNMGTIGGAICSGIPFYDMPTVLLALDSKISVVSADGERVIDAKDFFVDYFVTAISPEEIVREVKIPDVLRTGSSFVKLGRNEVDFAMVNASARITLDEKKRKVEDARIVLGAVSNVPIRHKKAEQYLVGNDATEECIIGAAKEPLGFDPSPSFHASSEYKRRVAPVVVREALLTAVRRAE